MKRLILVLLFMPFYLLAQEGTIVFEKVFHDFGLIEEERGMVIAEFPFVNTSKRKYKIVETKSSCGCTTIGEPKGFILKGDTNSIIVGYNPLGRAGKFSKTVEIVFEDNKGERVRRFLKIKGVTVSMTAKNTLKPVDNSQKERNVIYYYQQKKIDKKIDTKADGYKQLLETATKVALMHGKVNILITIYHLNPSYDFEKILLDTYDNIRLDLMEKGVPDNRIIFLDPVVELSSEDEYLQVSIINIGSYTLEHKEGIVRYVDGDSVVRVNNVEFYIQIGAFKKKKKASEFDSFGTTREYRDNEIYRYRVGTYPNLAKAKETLKLIKEKGYKDAFILAKNNDERITIAEADSIVRNQVIEKNPEVFHFSQLSLPIYMQYFTNGLRDIDTTSEQYKIFLDNLALYTQGNEDKIKLIVVSSASKWKYATDRFENRYIARLRGENSAKTLRDDLKAKGVNIEEIEVEIEDKVIGPPMNKRNYSALFYKQFQYLKIIPVYKITSEDNFTEGYIHYYKDIEEAINPRDYDFTTFIDRLVTEIYKKGVVKVSLEGSSSKTGRSPIYVKEKLAYVRIEDLKLNIERALYKRGINPQRFEVVEEITLVQGPEKGEGTEEEYRKAQYVKAIILNK